MKRLYIILTFVPFSNLVGTCILKFLSLSVFLTCITTTTRAVLKSVLSATSMLKSLL